MLEPMLTITEIAALLSVTPKTARDKIVTQPNFPAPVIRLSQRIRKWSQREVSEYLEKTSRAGR